jgi:phasin family protein
LESVLFGIIFGDAMPTIQDQIAAAARVQFDSQIALFSDMSLTALESIEKLVHLNLAAARASMDETSAAAVQVLSARDANEVMQKMRNQSGPNVGKAIAYGNHLVNIATNAQAEFARAAEIQFAQAGRKASELVGEAAKIAPPGVDNVLSLMRSAIGNASSGVEQVNKSTREAVEVLESNVNAAVNQIVQPPSSPKE